MRAYSRLFRFALCLSTIGVLGCGRAEVEPDPAALESAVPQVKKPAVPQGSVAERIAEANKLVASDDLEGAIRVLDEAVLIDAGNRELLGMLVQVYGDAAAKAKASDPGKFYRYNVTCGGYMRELRDKFPDLTDNEKTLVMKTLRNEATAHAKSLRVEETSGTLRELKAAGFTGFAELKADPDWAGIFAVEGFSKMFDELTAGK